MIGAVALGCFVTGFAVAWILRTAFTMAETSWWLKRMQYKVHYWQNQAVLARIVAERLNRQLTDLTGQEPVVLNWPRTANSGEEDWPW